VYVLQLFGVFVVTSLVIVYFKWLPQEGQLKMTIYRVHGYVKCKRDSHCVCLYLRP